MIKEFFGEFLKTLSAIFISIYPTVLLILKYDERDRNNFFYCLFFLVYFVLESVSTFLISIKNIKKEWLEKFLNFLNFNWGVFTIFYILFCFKELFLNGFDFVYFGFVLSYFIFLFKIFLDVKKLKKS